MNLGVPNSQKDTPNVSGLTFEQGCKIYMFDYKFRLQGIVSFSLSNQFSPIGVKL
jgi:hypothetical protein